MTAIAKYLMTAALVTAMVAYALVLWVWPSVPGAVVLAAGVAYVIQVVTFAILSTARGGRVIGAWASGTLLRLVTVLLTAFFVARSGIFPTAPVLLSLVGFLFLLMLLEPVFYRVGVRSR